MNFTRRLRVLGLSLSAALVVTLALAGQANAAKWLVLGTSITKNHTFTGTGGLTLFLIPPLNIEIHCKTGIQITGGVTVGVPPSIGVGITFITCDILSISPLEKSEVCNVTVLPIEAKGTAISSDEILLSPSAGSFTQMHFTNKNGEECNLEPSYNVTGTLRMLVESNNTTAPVLNPSVAQGGDVLKVGAHTTTIDSGKLTLKLTTPGDEGSSFGVC